MPFVPGADHSPRRSIARDWSLATRRIGFAATAVMCAATLVIAFAAPV